MASTDAKAVALWGVAHRLIFPILDADGDLVTGATGLDSEVSKDQDTFADCTNEATEIATSSGMYYLDLTATEMEADAVAVIVKTSSVDAKTTALVIYTDPATRTRKAQAGAAGTITLDASASATDDFYNDQVVRIVGGTGAGQARLVSDYVGSTKVASVVPNWATNPDSTSIFQVIPSGRVDVGQWVDGTPNALVSGRVDSSTGAMAADTLTASAIATGAIDADAIAADAITAAKVASDVSDEIAAKILVTPSQKLNTTPAGEAYADVKAWKTAAPDDLVAGAVVSYVEAIAANAITSGSFDDTGVQRIRGTVVGAADAGSSATLIVDADRTEAVTDYWKGMCVAMTDGVNNGIVRRITAFDPATDTLTVSPAFPSAVGVGDGYVILQAAFVEVLIDAVKANAIDATAIADNAVTANKIASQAITAAKIAAEAITASTFAVDAIISDVLADSAITEIQSGLATSAALATVQADTDNIQTRLPASLVGGRIDASVGAMASDTLTAAALAADAVTEIQAGLATAAALTTVQADTDDIQTRLPAALVDGKMNSFVDSMKTDALSSAAVSAGAVTKIQAGLAVPGDAMALTSDERTTLTDAILDLANTVDTYTLRQIFRLMAAFGGGKSAGGASDDVVQAIDDSKARITATLDSNGHRTAVTLDLS